MAPSTNKISPIVPFPISKTVHLEILALQIPNFYNGVMNCTIDAHKIDCNCLAFADLETEEGAKELKIFPMPSLLFGSLVLICKV